MDFQISTQVAIPSSLWLYGQNEKRIKMKSSILFIPLLLLLSCSNEKDLIQTYQVPKESVSPREKLPFSWIKPTSWVSEAPGDLKKAQFRLVYEKESAEAFLVYIEGKASPLAQNINRWRNQIGLAPVEELDIQLESLKTSFTEIQIYTCENESTHMRSIIAFWGTPKGKWFFKMNGNSTVLEAEKDNFYTFLKSMKPS